MVVGARGVSSLSVPRRVGEGSRPGSGLAPIPHPDMVDWPVQGNPTTHHIAMIIIVQSMVIGAVGVGILIVPYRVEEGPRPDLGHVPTQDLRTVARHVTGAQGKHYNAMTRTAQLMDSGAIGVD